MRKRKLACLVVPPMLLGAPVSAVNAGAPGVPPTVTTQQTEDRDTRAYAGVKWTFGKSVIPEVLVGVRSAERQSDGDVRGAQLSLSYDLATTQLGKLKLQALDGNESVQATAGIGYSFMDSAPLVSLGAHGNYLFGGVDLLIGPNRPDFHIGIDTLDSPDLPKARTNYSCDEFFTYNPGTGLCEPAGG
ncbi:hypothetical protein P8631_07595 [Guyparkeria sp. 1SP6A2]|nr:hypothetical protein [Guyparkeria sp. 1SP6A2]